MLTIPLVREPDAVDERVREAYRDIKATLRVQHVSLLFQAYASVARFLDYTWRRLRPNVLAAPFIEQARAIGARAERGVAAWPIGDHAAELRARNISHADISRMREIADMFLDVDPKLLVVAQAVRLGLDGVQVGGGGVTGPQFGGDKERLARDYRGLSAPMVEERDAPLRVRALYDDVKQSLGAPFVFIEQRAMGAFPDWLDLWWKDDRACRQQPGYGALRTQLDDAAVAAAHGLPYRLNLADEALARTEIGADERARIARVNASFCDLLPDVLIGAAVAQRGLLQAPPA
jgi:hypothetical protein